MDSGGTGSNGTMVVGNSVAEIAWLYYVKGLNQAEIAKKMGLSRPTIIAHLKTARAKGIVTIKLDPQHLRMNELSDRLVETFNLESAHVVPREGQKGMALTQAVSEVAAHLLPSFLKEYDVVGVSWGQTLALVAQETPLWPIEGLVVRQLIGSMSNPTIMTAESCTTDIARSLGGRAVNLNAPAVVSRTELASQLREEAIIKRQLENLGSCNKSLFSISLCTPDSHVVAFNVATPGEVEEYARRGAVCNLVGRFLDIEGNQVEGPLDRRVFAAEVEEIRQMEGMMIVAGSKKVDATLAALRGGFAKWLVIDDLLAERVLRAET